VYARIGRKSATAHLIAIIKLSALVGRERDYYPLPTPAACTARRTAPQTGSNKSCQILSGRMHWPVATVLDPLHGEAVCSSPAIAHGLLSIQYLLLYISISTDRQCQKSRYLVWNLCYARAGKLRIIPTDRHAPVQLARYTAIRTRYTAPDGHGTTTQRFLISRSYLLASMIGYWHDTVVCLSVCL